MKQTVLRDREGNKLPVHGFKNNNSIIFRVGLINNASLILRNYYAVITQMFINLRKVRNIIGPLKWQGRPKSRLNVLYCVTVYKTSCEIDHDP